MRSVKHKKKAVWADIAKMIEVNTGLKFTGGQVNYTVWELVYQPCFCDLIVIHLDF